MAILLTFTLVTMVFYELFQKQVMNDLMTYSDLLKETHFYVNGDKVQLDRKADAIRITIVDIDGEVVYDSNADAEEMKNHKNRPEIEEAIQYGTGKDIRLSETLDTNTFYYAVLAEDAYVIRVSKEADSILSVFLSAVPMLLLLLLILFVFCAFLGKICTKAILKPIDNMTKHMDDLSDVKVYTEMKPFVEAISKQHIEIITSANIRQEFTANVSHELKTPLASISGYSELIESGMATGEDVQHFAKEIHRNAKRLLTLINDIIRLSQLDASEFEINFEPVDLYEAAKTCVEMLSLNAENSNITISIEGKPVIVPGGKSMIEEVIYNLCDNGIRYNNSGGTVKVTVSEDQEYGKIVVEDNGIGISKENQKRVFERFYRVDKSRSKQTGGTGLGLAIVKHIAMNHNGQVQIDSELGTGTKIEIAFPKEEQ